MKSRLTRGLLALATAGVLIGLAGCETWRENERDGDWDRGDRDRFERGRDYGEHIEHGGDRGGDRGGEHGDRR